MEGKGAIFSTLAPDTHDLIINLSAYVILLRKFEISLTVARHDQMNGIGECEGGGGMLLFVKVPLPPQLSSIALPTAETITYLKHN